MIHLTVKLNWPQQFKSKNNTPVCSFQVVIGLFQLADSLDRFFGGCSQLVHLYLQFANTRMVFPAESFKLFLQ